MKYEHTIDLDELQKEMGMNIKEIADLVGINISTVYKWSWLGEKRGVRPTYNSIIKLLTHRASVTTLFGVKEPIFESRISTKISQDDILEGVRKALISLGRDK